MTSDKPFPDLLSDVQTEIAALRHCLAENRPCDAEALTPKLQVLIQSLPMLPREIGLAHQPAIEALQHDLGELADGFTKVKAATQAEMKTLNDRMKAATAYAQSAASEKR